MWNGHVNIGSITIYGANAMNWAVNISTKRWGKICFTLPCPARWRQGKYEWYFYLSPNATPWASTFYRGSNKQEIIRAQIRHLNFGHGFKYWNNPETYHRLMALNRKFDSMWIHEYDVQKHCADLLVKESIGD